jgi:hypothetical protein
MHLKNKGTVLLAMAVVLGVVLAVRAFWPDGLITLDFENAPLAKVLASVGRQSGVRIVTNLPPETSVTIHVKKVPLLEALETLAVRTESDLRAVYVGAATAGAAEEAFAGLQSGKPPATFEVAWFPRMGMSFGSTVPDPRSLVVAFEPEAENSLQSALAQIAQKSGVMTAVPRDWNPAVAASATRSTARDTVRRLFQSSGGRVVEGFFLFGRDRRQAGGEEDAGRRPGGPSDGWRGGGPGGGRMNPEWIAQRTEAMIAQLPPDEQPAAKAEFEAMRKVWEEVRALPEDRRREKMEEVFSRPEVQERMASREAARDARRTPEQREQRMKNYIERKKQMKGQTQ